MKCPRFNNLIPNVFAPYNCQDCDYYAWCKTLMEMNKISKAYAEFAEDISDAITAQEELRKKLKALNYIPPERPWKKGVGRIK